MNICKFLGTECNILGTIRPKLIKFNAFYTKYLSRIEILVFVLLITAITTSTLGKFKYAFILYYTLIIGMTLLRLYINWDFFYGACRLLAIKIELGLTKGKGFHNRLHTNKEKANNGKNRTNKSRKRRTRRTRKTI